MAGARTIAKMYRFMRHTGEGGRKLLQTFYRNILELQQLQAAAQCVARLYKWKYHNCHKHSDGWTALLNNSCLAYLSSTTCPIHLLLLTYLLTYCN
jgi:hypothetical protein